METGESVQVFAESVKENYQKAAEAYFHRLKLKCLQYRIDYAPVDIRKGFHQVLSAYLIKRNRIL